MKQTAIQALTMKSYNDLLRDIAAAIEPGKKEQRAPEVWRDVPIPWQSCSYLVEKVTNKNCGRTRWNTLSEDLEAVQIGRTLYWRLGDVMELINKK